MTKKPKAIARIAKLHRNDLSGSGSHTLRQRETPNADFDRKNIRLLGPDDSNIKLQDLVLEKIAEYPQKRKIRTDAVYCVELLLSASPEYFRPNQPEQYGVYDPERLERWVDENMKWLEKECSDRLVLAELHLDETTPHIAAYMVPLDENGQLNCRSLFGGREKMRAFQDHYAAAMAPLEIARGLPGSRANHWKIKQFYENINQSENLSVELSIDQLKAKAADRDRAVEDKEAIEATAQAIVERNKTLEQRLQSLQAGTTGNQELMVENAQLQDRVQILEAMLQGVEATEMELEPERTSNAELLPERDDSHWKTVRQRLSEEYKIPDWMVQELHQKELLYADYKKRAVFVKRTASGVAHYGLVLDEMGEFADLTPDLSQPQNSAFWVGIGEGDYERVVIVDDPLEVLAVAALDDQNQESATTLYISADQLEQLPMHSLIFASSVYVSSRCEDSLKSLLRKSGLETKEIDPRNTHGFLSVWQNSIEGDKYQLELTPTAPVQLNQSKQVQNER